MMGLDRGRKVAGTLVASAFIGVFAAQPVSAQSVLDRLKGKAAPAPTPAAAPAAELKPGEKPHLQEVRVPTNTTDPIAIINGEIITRQQLADECVAREGQKILDTMIAHLLIDQEIKKKKLDITAAEIDAEIDNVAMSVGHVSREVWLRTLDKERGISPATYARDIIYPSLALRKLAAGRVQVTEQDIKDAFEANYGPRLRCRIIMTNDARKAAEIWEELRKNPAGFEKIAQEKSLDTATRPFGGLLPDPIARHAVPREVSDAAFSQLVDGDPSDKNAAHKPKDGDFTGPIQVNEGAWVIIKREALAAGKQGSPNDPSIRRMLEAQMVDVKIKDSMNTLYADLMVAAAIDNKLTGQVKQGHEEQSDDFKSGLSQPVNRNSVAGETAPKFLPKGTHDVQAERTSSAKVPATQAPVGLPGDAPATANAVQNTRKTAPR